MLRGELLIALVHLSKAAELDPLTGETIYRLWAQTGLGCGFPSMITLLLTLSCQAISVSLVRASIILPGSGSSTPWLCQAYLASHVAMSSFDLMHDICSICSVSFLCSFLCNPIVGLTIARTGTEGGTGEENYALEAQPPAACCHVLRVQTLPVSEVR